MGYGMDEEWADEDWEDDEYPESNWPVMKQVYDVNTKKKVGETIKCPSCPKRVKKKSYQQKFCCTKCKDFYWNSAPRRIERTRFYNEL